MPVPFHIVTLGCDKNTVDSEQIAGILVASGDYIWADYSDADIIIINSCAFIDAAKEETIDTIVEAIEFKKQTKRPIQLIGAGCIVETDHAELTKEIPEVDLWIKPSDYGEILTILQGKKVNSTAKKGYISDFSERIAIDHPHYRFLKVSDGCNMACSYCTIPLIRGTLESRSLDSIRRELEGLSADTRLRELIIVSQNTLFYGTDHREHNVLDLITLLGRYDVPWKRMMYLDIRRLHDDVLKAMKDNGILPYFDIPLQHVDEHVLRSMNRPYTQKDIFACIDRIHAQFDNPILRTTFITGFPTETDAAFSELHEFVAKGLFHKIGVFSYSMQDKAPGAVLGDVISQEEKDRRRDAIMELQQEISADIMASYIGKEVDVLIDYDGEEGRMWTDAPDVDGVVFVDSTQVRAGEIRKVRIVESYEYDLEGEVID